MGVALAILGCGNLLLGIYMVTTGRSPRLFPRRKPEKGRVKLRGWSVVINGSSVLVMAWGWSMDSLTRSFIIFAGALGIVAGAVVGIAALREPLAVGERGGAGGAAGPGAEDHQGLGARDVARPAQPVDDRL